jgi:hypothetical protein
MHRAPQDSLRHGSAELGRSAGLSIHSDLDSTAPRLPGAPSRSAGATRSVNPTRRTASAAGAGASARQPAPWQAAGLAGCGLPQISENRRGIAAKLAAAAERALGVDLARQGGGGLPAPRWRRSSGRHAGPPGRRADGPEGARSRPEGCRRVSHARRAGGRDGRDRRGPDLRPVVSLVASLRGPID